MDLEEKFIWVYSGLGVFEIGEHIVNDYLFEFKPQKIVPISEPKNITKALDYFRFLPSDIELECGGNFGIDYTSNEEEVRVNWFKLVMRGWEHLEYLGTLVIISAESRERYKEFLKELNTHRVKYPELWI